MGQIPPRQPLVHSGTMLGLGFPLHHSHLLRVKLYKCCWTIDKGAVHRGQFRWAQQFLTSWGIIWGGMWKRDMGGPCPTQTEKQVRRKGKCALDLSQPGPQQASWYWSPANPCLSINSLICLEWK